MIKIITLRVWRYITRAKPDRITQEVIPKQVIELHYHYHHHEGASMSSTTVNNSGTMGFLNTGKISHVKNIETNIGKLQEGNSEVADAFSNIKSVIRDSKLVGSEEEREELLEALDGLTESAAQPEDKRGSLLKSSIRGFGQACQAIDDVAEIWDKVEGPIKSFFGLQ